MKKPSASNVTLTITVFVKLDRRMPCSRIRVRMATAITPTPTRHAGLVTPNSPSAYPAKPSAAVAADALLAHRNIQPAANPHQPFSVL